MSSNKAMKRDRSSTLSNHAQQLWYHCHGGYCVVALLLLPLSLLFYVLSRLRWLAYRCKLLSVVKLPVTLIVVGNISVGGTGKTPMAAYLVQRLRQLGYRPGLISRGYGGNSQLMPLEVDADADSAEVGDEALLLARRCQCPTVVAPDRVAAAQYLLQRHDCDVLISDDGLQHYRLGRDIELVLIDGQRGLGNGLLLPAGPLRETASRLKQADMIVATGESPLATFTQHLRPQSVVNLKDPQSSKPLSDFRGQSVVAVAGIGNPQRFFDSLSEAGVQVEAQSFADHHRYQASDFAAFAQQTILMTEKDAVKCGAFAAANMWYVSVEAELDQAFDERLSQLLAAAQQRLQGSSRQQ